MNHLSFKFSLFLLLYLSLVSCSFETSKEPSVILIAVEKLDFDSIDCGSSELQSEEYQGFQHFCEASVRFNHAFTPSIMSQAAMASILTAQYPSQHGLWHNGYQFLSANHKTLPEQLVKKNIKTSFFSGGPPMLYKSGLAQGFENFDDRVKVNRRQYFTPSADIFQKFFNWQENSVGQSPFFSVLFLADLQFENEYTMTNEDELRGLGFESQLREVSESLDYFITQMKHKKLWDSTYVILVGLNGSSAQKRFDELPTTNLHHDNTQIALFIKPKQKQRDLSINWTIDRNISLVDLGATLFDIYNLNYPSAKAPLSVTSLKSVLDKPAANWDVSRYILLESGWPQWRGIGSSRFAIRERHYLYINDVEPKLFNTLTDRNEFSQLSSSEPTWRQVVPPIDEFLQNNKFAAWSPVSNTLLDKLHLAQKYFRKNNERKAHLPAMELLAAKRPWDKQLWGWIARQSIKEKDWVKLADIAEQADQEAWGLLAKINDQDKQMPAEAEGCLRFFLSVEDYERPSPQVCDDEMFLDLIEVHKEKQLDQKEIMIANFFSKYRFQMIDNELAEINYLNSLRWDVPVNYPAGPSLSEMYLSTRNLNWEAAKIKYSWQKIKN